MSAAEYSVTLTNGGPWGFRLQGGKDFGKPLSIARVTPGGKADLQGILQGDIIEEINSQPADQLVHLDAQNLIKVSKDSLHLRLVRKPGNIAQSMGTKSPVVITETAHSARVDHKFNAKPRPFGVQSAPVQVKPVSRPAVDPDSFEDSEVLKMLKNSSISNDSGLSSSAHSSEDFDDLPPPPPEAFGAEDDQVPAGQSRTFKLLQRTVDGGESHPSVLSSPDSRPSTVSRPYNVTTNARSNKLPPQPMNTKEPPPCPPGVKPLQVLPSEVNFTRPSDAARAAYAERRQLGSSPTPAAPPPSQPYNSRPITAASPPSQPYNSRPITAASPPSQPYNSGPTTAAPPPSPPYNSGPSTAAHPPGQPYNCRPTTAASQPSQPYNSGHTTAAPQPSQPYNSGPTTAPKPRSPVSSSNPQNPHCHGCGQIIQGSFLSALGRNWHPEHFNCAGCRKSLQNKGFVEESDNLYCESCYDMKFSPHCDVCNQSIVGPCVKAIGKMFHPEHFICAHCGKQIANESFHLDSGKPYCAQDYKDLFCVKCCTCKQVIGGGDRWLEALDKPWHADCFRCAVCGQNLENTGFYSMGSQAVCPKHA